MSTTDPLGRLALIVIVLVLFYDVIFSLVKFQVDFIVNMFNNLLNTINNMIVLVGGGQPVFPQTEKAITSIFSWMTFLFTNSLALAFLFFMDVIKRAFSSQ